MICILVPLAGCLHTLVMTHALMSVFRTAPPVIHSPQNYTVIEGSDVVITFDILGHPFSDTLQYFSDGIPLDLITTENNVPGRDNNNNRRISLLADRPGSLLIRGVRREDSGVYSILARNSVGEGTVSTHLIVLCRYSIPCS